jgi:hypothetical protein
MEWKRMQQEISNAVLLPPPSPPSAGTCPPSHFSLPECRHRSNALPPPPSAPLPPPPFAALSRAPRALLRLFDAAPIRLRRATVALARSLQLEVFCRVRERVAKSLQNRDVMRRYVPATLPCAKEYDEKLSRSTPARARSQTARSLLQPRIPLPITRPRPLQPRRHAGAQAAGRQGLGVLRVANHVEEEAAGHI